MRRSQIYEQRGDGHRQRRSGDEHRLTRGLGWFSIGLGLGQLLAPDALTRTIGIRPSRRSRATMTMVGLREIASGIGLLSARSPASWAWLRLGGDVIDVALLATAPRAKRVAAPATRTSAALAAVVGVAVVDAVAAAKASSRNVAVVPFRRKRARQWVTATITIGREPEDVYRFWRNFGNLPRFMNNVASIEVTDDRRSHWVVRGPAGTKVEWDAEIVEDDPNELIAWRSKPGADVDNAGSVRFTRAPGDRGTEVHVRLRWGAGRLGAALAKLAFADPEQQIRADLRRLKQVLETGSVVHSDASVHRWPHPARPTDEPSKTTQRGQWEVRV